MTYNIAVDGHGGVTGTFELSWELVPSPLHDDFVAAQALEGHNGLLQASNAFATREPLEPYHAYQAGGASVWYVWTAPFAGDYQFETCGSAVDTLLAAYTGAALGSLSAVVYSDDACGEGSRIVIRRAAAGAVYRIAVDDAVGLGGAFVLRWASIASAPTNVSPPRITGDMIEGSTHTAETGVWLGVEPIVFTLSWERCTDALMCTAIATTKTFSPRAEDVGLRFRLRVRASNQRGMTEVVSPLTEVIRPRPPRNTEVPRIAGTARVGQAFVVDFLGGWVGRHTSFNLQWQRCVPNLSMCSDIAGEKDDVYRLAAADLGRVVRVAATASNAAGSATAVSAPSAVIRVARACVVPRLRGKTVAAGRKALVRGDCRLGKVARRRDSMQRGRIFHQSAKPGRRLKPRARVGVVLSLGRKR